MEQTQEKEVCYHQNPHKQLTMLKWNKNTKLSV